MYTPAVDQNLVVDLPGEKLIARVCQVLGTNHVIVELFNQPLTRNHFHRKGDFVPCERVRGELGEAWVAMDERRLRQLPVIEPEQNVARETREPESKPKSTAKKAAPKATKKPKPKRKKV